MPHFKLNADARRLLASCIEIGLEGAPCSTDEENANVNAIGALLDELQESEATETIISIRPTESSVLTRAHTIIGLTMDGHRPWTNRMVDIQREAQLIEKG